MWMMDTDLHIKVCICHKFNSSLFKHIQPIKFFFLRNGYGEDDTEEKDTYYQLLRMIMKLITTADFHMRERRRLLMVT